MYEYLTVDCSCGCVIFFENIFKCFSLLNENRHNRFLKSQSTYETICGCQFQIQAIFILKRSSKSKVIIKNRPLSFTFLLWRKHLLYFLNFKGKLSFFRLQILHDISLDNQILSDWFITLSDLLVSLYQIKGLD